MRKEESTEYTAEDQGMDLDLTGIAESTRIRYTRTARYQGKRGSLIERLNDPSGGLGSLVREMQGEETPSLDHVMRIVIYLRVSTEEQARVGGEIEGYSIPAQREACLIKVRQLGGILVEEYVDAGESAKSANRPELQKMLRELKSRKIDYVIVHKIDRLARNRADDVEINAAIARAGAKLISASEPVDETPAGRLLYNMMADVAQYHSDNLAVEVLKGMDSKAKAGGTPYRAPIGYLNHREFRDGADVRTVIIDPERGSLVRWAFEQYALGDWAIRQLVDALNAQGLRTRATRKRTAKPLTINGVHHMLRNPYYMGVVPYRGIYHEGKHEPLVSSETWLRVQDVLSAHRLTGEKERKHPHYLKGTIFCGECGARLIYSENTGKSGGVYVYYVCLSHLTKRQPCARKYVRLDKIEPAIEDFYRSLRLPADRAEVIRAGVMKELESEREEVAQNKRRAEKRLKVAEEQRAKLIQAHYAGAVPLDLMKGEMARLTRDIDEARQAITDATRNVTNLEDTLNLALEMAKDCANQYLVANPRIRRLINQGLFKKLYINEDGTVERFEMTEPFATLLDPELLEDLANAEPAASIRDEAAAELPPATDRSDEERTSLARMFTCEKRPKKNQPDVSYVRLGSNMITLVRVRRL